ncbi:hypothetical protein KC721_01105 [Candidatus Woesebacteria bacterium]|nr:hypothetical protein [Candidatus Woesebacteria bacterium]
MSERIILSFPETTGEDERPVDILSFPETTGEGERRVYATPQAFFEIFKSGIVGVTTLPDLDYIEEQINITAEHNLLNPVIEKILEVLISFKRRELLFPLRSSFFENFLKNLQNAISFDELFELETQAEGALETELLTEQGLKLIKEKIEEKRQQLQKSNFETIKTQIPLSIDENTLDAWEQLVNANLALSMITKDQWLELLELCAVRRASLTQYI